MSLLPDENEERRLALESIRAERSTLRARVASLLAWSAAWKASAKLHRANEQQLPAALDEQTAKLNEARARVAELEAALQPLAAMDVHIPADAEDRWRSFACGVYNITVGDIRRARALLVGES